MLTDDVVGETWKIRDTIFKKELKIFFLFKYSLQIFKCVFDH